MSKTHNEIMVEDGFELISKKRRRLIGPKIEDTFDDTISSVSEEQARLAVKHAHNQIDEYLESQMQDLFTALRDSIGNERPINTIRSIGLGNFYSHGCDSSLQMAVLERLHSEFNSPPTFYQEPRCLEGEKCYIEEKFNFLPSDSLKTIPPMIVEQMKDVNLVFMIHFDHFGFEYLLNSFEALGLEKSLVFIGNSVPIDYKGELPAKLSENFNCQPLPMPEKPKSSTQRDKCMLWWRKAFANTSIYFHKYLIGSN